MTAYKNTKLKEAYAIPLLLFTTGIIPNTQNENLKVLNVRPAIHILMQKAAILNTSMLAEQCLVSETVLF